jgi:hypothetical protein
MQAVLCCDHRCHSLRSLDLPLVGVNLVSGHEFYDVRENKDILAFSFWCLRMCSLGAGVGLKLIVARYLSVSLVAEQAIAVRFPGSPHPVRTTSRAVRNIT